MGWSVVWINGEVMFLVVMVVLGRIMKTKVLSAWMSRCEYGVDDTDGGDCSKSNGVGDDQVDYNDNDEYWLLQ